LLSFRKCKNSNETIHSPCILEQRRKAFSLLFLLHNELKQEELKQEELKQEELKQEVVIKSFFLLVSFFLLRFVSLLRKK